MIWVLVAYLLVGLAVGLTCMVVANPGTDFTGVLLIGVGSLFTAPVWPGLLLIIALGLLGRAVIQALQPPAAPIRTGNLG